MNINITSYLYFEWFIIIYKNYNFWIIIYLFFFSFFFKQFVFTLFIFFPIFSPFFSFSHITIDFLCVAKWLGDVYTARGWARVLAWICCQIGWITRTHHNSLRIVRNAVIFAMDPSNLFWITSNPYFLIIIWEVRF